MALLPPIATAQVAVGPEFLVNSYTLGDQHSPATGSTSAGQVLTVWERLGDGSGLGLFGQVYDENGVPVGGEFLVNTVTVGSQQRAAVAGDGAGRFVVVWASGGLNNEVRGQRFDSTGAPIGGEFQINTYTPGDQGYPSLDVATAANGDFVVAWSSYYQDGEGLGVFGQRFNNLGAPVGGEFQINTYTPGDQGLADNHSGVAVARSPAGDFVVVWTGGYDQDGDGSGIFAQRFAAAGGPLGGEFQVNRYTPDEQGASGGPDIAADGVGRFVVTWDSYGQDGDDNGVFATRIDSAGALGLEFQVNTVTAYSQGYGGPAVAADPAGNFTIVWASDQQDGAPGAGVFGQRYLADETPVGGDFRVNTFTTGLQWFPDIAADWRGCQQVVWRVGAADSNFACTMASQCPKFPAEDCVNNLCERIDEQDGQDGAIAGQRYCRAPALNHYKCYKVTDRKSPPFVNIPGVSLIDQFVSEVVTVKRIKMLCNPVDKNGEGIPDPSLHLCCHITSGTSTLSPYPEVQVADQFQSSRLRAIKGLTLCAPCTKADL